MVPVAVPELANLTMTDVVPDKKPTEVEDEEVEDDGDEDGEGEVGVTGGEAKKKKKKKKRACHATGWKMYDLEAG